MPTGRTYGIQSATVWLSPDGTWDPYVWGGCCMRIGEITDNLGGQNVTFRQSARGGVVRDAVRDDVPGDVTSELAMKHLQWDRTKGELTRCRWYVDKRTHCNDLDDPHGWEEIRRIYYAKTTERVDTGSTWEADEDGMITLSIAGLETFDIYPVSASSYTFGGGT